MLVIGVSSLKYSHDVYSSFITLLFLSFFYLFVNFRYSSIVYAVLVKVVNKEQLFSESGYSVPAGKQRYASQRTSSVPNINDFTHVVNEVLCLLVVDAFAQYCFFF